MLQGYAIAVVHAYIMTAVYQVGTAEVGADGFIVQGQLIGIVEFILKFSTAALGIALTRPFLTAAVLAGAGNGSVMVNIVAYLVFGSLSIEFIGFLAEAALGNINNGFCTFRSSGDDVDNTALSTAAVHGSSTAAHYLDALDVIHIVHECGKHITAAACALEVVNTHSVNQDNNVLAAVDADTAYVGIQAVGAVIQELYARNCTQNLFHVVHVHLLDFLTADNAHICFSLQDGFLHTGSGNNDRCQLKAHFVKVCCGRLRCIVGGYCFNIFRLGMLCNSSCFFCLLHCRLGIESLLLCSNTRHCVGFYISSRIFLNLCRITCNELFSLSLTADFLLWQTVQCKAQAAAELPVMLVICTVAAGYIKVCACVRLNIQGSAKAHFSPCSLSFYRGSLAAAVLCAVAAGDIAGELMRQAEAGINRAQTTGLAKL